MQTKNNPFKNAALKKLRNFQEMPKKIVHARIRVLPLVIFMCLMLLTVKINILQQHLEESTAFAETTSGNSGVTTASNSASSHDTKTTETPDLTKLDTNKISSEKYKLLKEVGDKKKLPTTEETEKLKESALEAAESRIDTKMIDLKEMEKTLKSYLDKAHEKQDEQIVKLVKMTEKMDAKQAAKILEGVEFPILLELMERIKESKGSEILQNMGTEKASFLMSELAKRGKSMKDSG